MSENSNQALLKLKDVLQDLTKHYRQLLELVRKEKEHLINVDIDGLNQTNAEKDHLLHQIRMVDTIRERVAGDVCQEYNLDRNNPRLLEIARCVGGLEGDKLRNVHSALELLIKRISELNKENEEYAQVALKNINGAIGEIRQTLGGKKTYGKKGKVATSEQPGNFISQKA